MNPRKIDFLHMIDCTEQPETPEVTDTDRENPEGKVESPEKVELIETQTDEHADMERWHLNVESPQAAAQSIDDLLGTAEFHHFDSPEAEKNNQEWIEDYSAKKRTADLAMLKTQRDVLERHHEYIDQDNLERFCCNFGANQLEVYDYIVFENKYLRYDDMPQETKDRICGLHKISDGAICIRDTKDMELLKKTTVHETLHDLSYHGEVIEDVDACSEKIHHEKRGLHEITFRELNEGKTKEYINETGRALNEGVTELLTLEEMEYRRERADVLSYTLEVGWTRRIMERVGRENVERAYFAGDDAQLRACVESRTNDAAFWQRLLGKMDMRHQAYSAEDRVRLEKEINEMINQL